MTREEAIKMLKSKMDGHTDTSYEWAETVRMAIKALEQEPRKGHWEHDRVNVRCSNCGRGYKDAFGRTSAITYNFCPNCGADMREVEE